MVFTYIARRTRGTIVKGQRYPITYSGIKTEWRRLRSRAQIEGFRFHDFRHDFGTKLLRQTGNLKLVQKALNHADIKTTTRYAHVLTEEVAEALETLQKSRNNSGKPANRVKGKANSDRSHMSGGPGVGSSNLPAPTISPYRKKSLRPPSAGRRDRAGLPRPR